MKFCFESEFAFAKEFYTQAIEGLEESEYPPHPDEWLENPHEYKTKWEFCKSALAHQYENTEDEEEKENILIFLQCTLCVYFDLMCSISVMRAGGKDSYTQMELIELLKDEGLIKLKNADDYIDKNTISGILNKEVRDNASHYSEVTV